MRKDALCLLLTACGAAGAAAAADAAKAELGRQLFLGAQPLDGRIAGHSADLPASASRCANCHLAERGQRPVSASASRPAAFGPDLTAENLTRPRSRRGGPPSTYDEKSLCKVLRTGIDPVQILMPAAMPRYAVSDRECEAIWGYLSQHTQ
jgi:hypothetical protein